MHNKYVDHTALGQYIKLKSQLYVYVYLGESCNDEYRFIYGQFVFTEDTSLCVSSVIMDQFRHQRSVMKNDIEYCGHIGLSMWLLLVQRYLADDELDIRGFK